MILTNRRILTISASKDTKSDQYGVELCYTPPRNLRTAVLEETVDGFDLHLEIKNARKWKLSFADEQMTSVADILTLLNL